MRLWAAEREGAVLKITGRYCPSLCASAGLKVHGFICKANEVGCLAARLGMDPDNPGCLEMELWSCLNSDGWSWHFWEINFDHQDLLFASVTHSYKYLCKYHSAYYGLNVCASPR